MGNFEVLSLVAEWRQMVRYAIDARASSQRAGAGPAGVQYDLAVEARAIRRAEEILGRLYEIGPTVSVAPNFPARMVPVGTIIESEFQRLAVWVDGTPEVGTVLFAKEGEPLPLAGQNGRPEWYL